MTENICIFRRTRENGRRSGTEAALREVAREVLADRGPSAQQPFHPLGESKWAVRPRHHRWWLWCPRCRASCASCASCLSPATPMPIVLIRLVWPLRSPLPALSPATKRISLSPPHRSVSILFGFRRRNLVASKVRTVPVNVLLCIEVLSQFNVILMTQRWQQDKTTINVHVSLSWWFLYWGLWW